MKDLSVADARVIWSEYLIEHKEKCEIWLKQYPALIPNVLCLGILAYTDRYTNYFKPSYISSYSIIVCGQLDAYPFSFIRANDTNYYIIVDSIDFERAAEDIITKGIDANARILLQ